MKQTIKVLGEYAYKKGIDFGQCFNDMLDFFIGTFDMQRVLRYKCDYAQLFNDREQENPVLFSLLIRWIKTTNEGIAKDGAFDFFGTLYEEAVKSKFKASGMGQFFTPISLCQAMSEIISDDTCKTVNDCACGSGRTLLAYFAKSDKTKFIYYQGEDLDPICVKMCTLNFMIHGMLGRVIHHDALMQDFLGGYEVNEIRWPVPNNMCCIRQLTGHEPRKLLFPKNEPTAAVKSPPKKVPKEENQPQQLFFNF